MLENAIRGKRPLQNGKLVILPMKPQTMQYKYMEHTVIQTNILSSAIQETPKHLSFTKAHAKCTPSCRLNMHWVTAKTNRLTKCYPLGNKTESCIQLFRIQDFYFMNLRNFLFPAISNLYSKIHSLLIIMH